MWITFIFLLKVDCNDWNSDGSKDFIGQFTTKLSEMEKAGKPNEVNYNFTAILLLIYTTVKKERKQACNPIQA